MPTIAYDKKVANFIAGLNATGHVTHTKHRKGSVTLHHNGGRLSLQGILNVWKTRPASAHFQVDGKGNIGQYVNVNEYAWATGTTKGNQDSISIEMANSAVGGNWPVAPNTWHSAARLAAWLHWKVIGVAPTRGTLKVHHDWKSTLCAGPYIDKVYPQILQLSRWWYNQFRAGKAAKPAPKPTPRPAPQPIGRKTNQQLANEVLAGRWGAGEERKRRLTAAGYNYSAVQAIVNARFRGGAPVAHRPSIVEVAQQVINGDWGNGEERKRRLEGAGYNYREVQDVVNRLV
jgi:CW_7 repeat/N-acetylmuramoyl-L-alanine amidase